MTGHIFNIQKFCLHDGPGIRTTVFFKGCNLRCKWCANPESQKSEHQITLDTGKCTACGKCVDVCTMEARTIQDGTLFVDAQRCAACGGCLTACMNGAIGKEGRRVTAEEVVKEVLKDKAFYDHSGGGVTFSGGEVLLQKDFAKHLAEMLRQQSVSIAIETAGAVPEKVFREMLCWTDYVLMDLKHYDSQAHMVGTGVDNRQILENVQILRDSDLPFLIRIPVIPGFNDRVEDAEAFGKLLKRLDISQVELLPFHQLGQHKYAQLHMDYDYADCSQLHHEDLTQYREVLEHYDLEVKA